MSDLLICTMGLSPGVVTGITRYLQQEKKVSLEEVQVVFPNNQTLFAIYNHILRREFDEELDLKNKHRPKDLQSSDVETTAQIIRCAKELAELIHKAFSDTSGIIHLCISGGRKTMTYAAAIAVQAVAAQNGEDLTAARLCVWHIQMTQDEISEEEVLQLLNDYRANNISAQERNQILYPESARVVEVPYFKFPHQQQVEMSEEGLSISDIVA